MNRKIFLKLLLGLLALAVLIRLLTKVFAEPWVGKKIESSLNENIKDFSIEIGKTHLSLITRGIELEGVIIRSKQGHEGYTDFNGEIASVKVKGIKLAKALFKKDIDIREVIISNSSIKGTLPLSREVESPAISTLSIHLHKVILNQTDLAIKDSATAQSYSVKKGALTLYDLQVEKQDTLSTGIIKEIDFEADEFFTVSDDSMYAYKASSLSYSANSKTLTADSFSIHPNYENYDFTSRYKYQTDRIDADFVAIRIHAISAADYFKSKSLKSSFVEIGTMDLQVFRDKRKEFRHVNKAMFQDLIYNYPGAIHIDSIGLINGNVIYTEHAEDANEPGSIRFNEIRANIYKISNDTVFKTQSAYLELKGETLLMGKGKMKLLLKAKIFDPNNTVTLNGTLSGMEVKALNPMLEKNAYVFATSGEINKLDFSFTANNTRATGNMHMLYHGLDLAVKSKRTDDTTAFKERFISLIANKRVLDSNPLPGEEVRVGIIDFERDPEKFLFNYCFKAILTGIKSSLTKSPKEKKNS